MNNARTLCLGCDFQSCGFQADFTELKTLQHPVWSGKTGQFELDFVLIEIKIRCFEGLRYLI